MQKYSYPRFVDKKNIEKIEDMQTERLFKLSIPLLYEGDKTVLIITRSPRDYNLDGSSHIVTKGLKYIKSKRHDEFLGVSKVEFVFLFPIRGFDDDFLYPVLEEKGERYFFGNEGFYDEQDHLIKNDEMIFLSMMTADYIIFAWGDTPASIEEVGYERIKYILKAYKMIKNNTNEIKETYRVGRITSHGSPKHCLSWRENDFIEKFEF
ncbi:MAG: hypothetical protein ACRC57_07155 [Sarcina sp.]